MSVNKIFVLIAIDFTHTLELIERLKNLCLQLKSTCVQLSAINYNLFTVEKDFLALMHPIYSHVFYNNIILSESIIIIIWKLLKG